jgi:hypothetical protein
VDVRCQSLNEFKRLYNFYFRISAFYFGKQSKFLRHTFLQGLTGSLVSRAKGRWTPERFCSRSAFLKKRNFRIRV